MTALRRSLAGVVAVLAAALIAPRISADAYRGRIQTALENALGRKIEISSVRFRLLPQPGFTASEVTIGEDPAIGAEPVAYVGTLRATPRIAGLLRGRLEFGSVSLEDASLNLTRVDNSSSGVQWNFSSLLRPQFLSAFPSVHMRDGRINFKFGETKSILYLLETDVDLWPPSSAAGPWTLRVHAKPARTDRTAMGFGTFSLRGQWHPADNSTTLDVKLEKSELGDILTLFNGYETGVEGNISGDAHLAGPMTRIGLAGRVTVANLHGWNQTPPRGNEWPLAIGGVMDAPAETIDLTARVAGPHSPFDLRYRVADYLRRPRWGVTAHVTGFALSPLAGIARNLGWAIPADFKLDGTAAGAVSYSMPEGAARMDGKLSLANSTLAVPGAPPLRIPNAEVQFMGSTVTLAPAAITNDRDETAMLEGAWDMETRTLQASLSSDGMAIASLRRQISTAGIPLLSEATEGTWKGNLRYSNNPAGWNGELHLEDTVIPFEAFADPLRIVTADAKIDGAGVEMKRLNVSIGGMKAQGEYYYDTFAARPHKFRIAIADTSAAAIEKLLMPALRRGNFFTYAFNFGRLPAPDWLRNMHADGIIQVGSFDLAGNEFTKLRSRVLWDGTEVRLSTLQTRFGTASFAGAGTVHLDRRQPAYEIEGKLSGMPWRSGTMDAEGTIVTSGTGTGLLDHLRAKGSFEGAGIDLAPLDEYDSVAGTFDFTWDGRNPRMHLTQLVMKAGEETYQGSADTQDNGQVVVKLTDGTRHIQAAGAILRGDVLKISP